MDLATLNALRCALLIVLFGLALIIMIAPRRP